jgi:hypothetical protein
VDPQASITISAAVVTLTSLVKWGGLPDKLGPLAVLVLSAMGCVIWSYSQEVPFARTQSFAYFATWATVATSAAGIFGFTRASGAAVSELRRPPEGAGQNPTEKP